MVDLDRDRTLTTAQRDAAEADLFEQRRQANGDRRFTPPPRNRREVQSYRGMTTVEVIPGLAASCRR